MIIKLLLLNLLFFSSLLYSSQNLDIEYQEALEAYKQNNFALSYEKFSKLYISNLSDIKMQFYLGRSAYETGHYEIALAAFERVEMLEPSNLRNKLEMGRTYFMLKMYEDAQTLFKEVLQNPNLPQNVRTNIEIYLSKVTKVQEKSFTYATLNLDWVYDSNVNYGSLEDAYATTIGTLLATKERSDRAMQLYGDITNIYDLGEKNGFAIKNRFTGFIKDYFEENDYNIQYISYTPSVIYAQTHTMFEFAGSIDSLSIATKNYLESFSLMPKIEFAHTTTLRSITYAKYQRKSFQQKTEIDLDANHYELSYALQKILSPRSYVQGNIIAIKEKKLHGERIDVDYTEYRANLAYANQLTATYATNLFAEYKQRSYDDFSTLFDSTRRDNTGSFMADINARILPSLRMHLKGMYTRVDSNQERFSYEKYTLSLGLNKTF
jgi:hypothetical protein